MPVRMTHTSHGEAGRQCPAASMAVTWLSNKPLKLNVPQTETLTSVWILTPPPLPHRPPPLAQLMAAPSVQAKSLRVTWTLLLSHPHPTHQQACGLQLHTVPESAHCLARPWPPAGPGPPSSASRISVVAHRGLHILLHRPWHTQLPLPGSIFPQKSTGPLSHLLQVSAHTSCA